MGFRTICHLCMSYRCSLAGVSQPFRTKISAASIALFGFRRDFGPNCRISFVQTVSLFQRPSQSNIFWASLCGCSIVASFGRPLTRTPDEPTPLSIYLGVLGVLGVLGGLGGFLALCGCFLGP